MARQAMKKKVHRTKNGRKRKTGSTAFKKKVRAVIQDAAEHKWIDTTANTTVSSTGTFFQMPIPTQGSTRNERVGDDINIRSWNWRIAMTVASADVTNFIRIIVFSWNQLAALGAPTTADILDAPLNPIVSTIGRYSLAEKRMTLVYDRVFKLSSFGDSYTQFHKINIFGKRLPHKRQDIAGGNAVGLMYMLAISDSSAAAHPGFNYYNRFTFTDF